MAAGDARVVMDKGALEAFLRGPNGVSMKELSRRAYKVHRRAAEECPVDEGRLRSSLHVKFGTDARGPFATVGTDVEYALYVHEGTKPHIIRPVNARVLAFPAGGRRSGGAMVFARVVHHPGTRAQPFLRNALEEVRRG